MCGDDKLCLLQSCPNGSKVKKERQRGMHWGWRQGTRNLERRGVVGKYGRGEGEGIGEERRGKRKEEVMGKEGQWTGRCGREKSRKQRTYGEQEAFHCLLL